MALFTALTLAGSQLCGYSADQSLTKERR